MALLHIAGCSRLVDAGPYRPWQLTRRDNGPWGISGAQGFNCFAGSDGAVFLPSREEAEAIIRSHGHEPGEVRLP